MVKSLENKILENSDNITVIKPDDNDEPEMAALKEAINCKNCDINLYYCSYCGYLCISERRCTIFWKVNMWSICVFTVASEW